MNFRYINFVVTGCPRSGTGYLAKCLTALGYSCSHEDKFNPWHAIFAENREDLSPWGDSSWMAAPYLRQLPEATRVVHVVRDPVATINSIMGTGQLNWPNDYRDFAALHLWGSRRWYPEDLVTAAEFFWVRWNRMITSSGRVSAVVRLEDAKCIINSVAAIDPGRTLSQREFDLLSNVATNENARPHFKKTSVSTVGSECLELARSYGFEAADGMSASLPPPS